MARIEAGNGTVLHARLSLFAGIEQSVTRQVRSLGCPRTDRCTGFCSCPHELRGESRVESGLCLCVLRRDSAERACCLNSETFPIGCNVTHDGQQVRLSENG